MDLIHEYERTVVIRLRYRTNGDGLKGWMRIDSDLQNRDELIGVLQRAQWHVGQGEDEQHDRLDPAALPAWEPGEDDFYA